jgi:hypothetical protein
MYKLTNSKSKLIEINRKKQEILLKILEHNKKIKKILENNNRILGYKKDWNRINFYLGFLEKDISFKNIYKNINNSESFFKFLNIKDLYNKKNNITHSNNLKNNYLEPLYNVLINYKINKQFIFFVQTGDVQHILNIPCFTKNIINERNNNKGVILRCFNFKRHWYNYYNKPLDIPYENKNNKIIWRGNTSGNLNRKGNRFILIEKWFNKNKNIDVGFSHISPRNKLYQSYLKKKMTIKEMLNYKYIISVEGNDKDSGINWKLNSNSLVLMPKPCVSSWLMETTLIPNYHYLLLEDDFSDLEEKFIWCENNQDKCKEIIKNANNYMKQFENEHYERFLEKCVIEEFLNFYN